MKPKEVLALCREKDVKAVDLRFMDFRGHLAAFHHPSQQAGTRTFSKTAGFRRLEHSRLASDQRKRHDPGAAARDGRARSVHDVPTISMICNIQDPITRKIIHAIRVTWPASR